MAWAPGNPGLLYLTIQYILPLSTVMDFSGVDTT